MIFDMDAVNSALSHETVFADLGPFDNKGSYAIGTCPDCREKTFVVYRDKEYGFCQRKNRCGTVWGWYAYTRDRYKLSQRATFQKLAELAGIKIDCGSTPSPEYLAATRRTDLFEATAAFCTDLARSNPGAAPSQYMKSRGFDPDQLYNLGFGHFPVRSKLEAHLTDAGFNKAEIDGSYVLSRYLEVHASAVFPFRDRSGRMRGLLGRMICPSLLNIEREYKELLQENPDDTKIHCLAQTLIDAFGSDEIGKPLKSKKYYLIKGMPRDGLYMSYLAKRRELTIVEGYLDALRLCSLDYEGAVATGTNFIGSGQLTELIKMNPRRIFLGLDNDRAGHEGTIKALRQLLPLTNASISILDYRDAKDGDEFISKYGLAEFEIAKSTASSAAKWLARLAYGRT